MFKRFFITIVALILTGAISMAAGKKFVLVIDAGHGGNDPGAIGAVAKEKNINLGVALAFGKYVENNCPDVTVIYTRKTDVFIPLQERAQIANRNKADLFISIHTNALEGGKISRGMETYTLGMHRAADNLAVAKRENSVILIEKNYKQTYAGFDPKSAESYIMFELMQDKNMANSVELAKLIQSETCRHAGRVDKGVHQAGFLVLRETSMPSCLVELGFITTSDEEAFLNSNEGQDKMAKGIFNAFVKYKNKYGTVNQPPSQTTPQQPARQQQRNAKPGGSSSPAKPRADIHVQEDAVAQTNQPVTNDSDEMNFAPFPVNTSAVVVEDTMLMAAVEYAEPQKVRRNMVANKAPTSTTPSTVADSPSTPQPTTAFKPTPPPVVQTDPKPEPQPQPTTQPEPKSTPQLTAQTEPKPTPQSTAQTESKPTPQPAAQTEPKPTPQSTAQTESKPTPKPQSSTQTTPNLSAQSDDLKKDDKEVGGRPIFKVQIVATSQQIPVDSPQFLDVKGISFYTENDMFKYTVGASPDFDEISGLKKDLQTKFPQAFIIAFRDGEKINTGEAIREYKRNKSQQ